MSNEVSGPFNLEPNGAGQAEPKKGPDTFSSRAILLIAHGSRRADANADLEFVASRIRERGRYPIVRTAFLELAEPGIEAGAAACVEAGATGVILLPYFLAPGVHVVEDLAAARDRLAGRFPDVRFVLAEPLGRHPLLVDVVEERARQTEG